MAITKILARKSRLDAAIEDANDLGHLYMLMEHAGYEIHHGSRRTNAGPLAVHAALICAQTPQYR